MTLIVDMIQAGLINWIALLCWALTARRSDKILARARAVCAEFSRVDRLFWAQQAQDLNDVRRRIEAAHCPGCGARIHVDWRRAS